MRVPVYELLAPQTTVLPAPVVTLPAGPFAVNGTPAPVTGVSVAGAALVELTLSVQNGTLNVSKTAGVEVDNGGTSSIELSGTVANVNAALATLVYTGNAGFVGTDSLSVSATAVAELTPPPDVLDGPPASTPVPIQSRTPITGTPVTLNTGGVATTGITYNAPPANRQSITTTNVNINFPTGTTNPLSTTLGFEQLFHQHVGDHHRHAGPERRPADDQRAVGAKNDRPVAAGLFQRQRQRDFGHRFRGGR